MVGLLGPDVESYFLEGGEMKLEVGKKYKHKTFVFDVKFIDYQGTAWGVCDKNMARYISPGDFSMCSEYTEPKPPQYVPYTWEDREQLRGRWYRLKENKSEQMIRSVCIDSCDCDVLCIDGMTSGYFMDSCEWLDGTPCGKVVE